MPKYAWKHTQTGTRETWALVDDEKPTGPHKALITFSDGEVWGRLKGALESQRAASVEQAMARIHDQLGLDDKSIAGSLVGTASGTPAEPRTRLATLEEVLGLIERDEEDEDAVINYLANDLEIMRHQTIEQLAKQ